MNRRDLLKLLLAVPTATLFPKPKLPKSIGALDLAHSAGAPCRPGWQWVENIEWIQMSSNGWLLIGGNWDKTMWLDPRPRE